jgi:tol-pal system protein YbgF
MKLYTLVTAAKMAAVVVLGTYLAIISLLYSSSALSQATVRDSSPVTSNTAIPASSSQSAVSNGALTSRVISSSSNAVVETQPGLTPPPLNAPNTAYQIQQLQREVSELRGLVEEQAFNLKRLKQQRLDDYLDLDKRLSAVNPANVATTQTPSTLNSSLPNFTDQNSSTPNAAVQNNTSNPSPAITGISASLPISASSNAEEGKKLYRKAIDQLLSQQDYNGAQTSFSQYLTRYPTGIYVPNVYYWQGQIYLTESNKAAAEKAFTSLVSQYNDHQKAPDAKYKLATIYFDQGKKAEAKKLLNEVVASDTDASRLAKSFLANQY